MVLSCKICNFKNHKILFKKDNYLFMKCTNCSLVSIDPIPSMDDLIYYYDTKNEKNLNYDTNQYELKKFVDFSFRDLILDTISISKNAEIIDIGCYCGLLLDAFKEKGYKNLNGIEMQDQAYKVARAKHNKIFKTTLEDFSKKKQFRGKFDLVIASGLIEHLRNPNNLVKVAANLLKDDGILVIQTPFADSFLAKILGRFWPPYSAPEHIHYFSRKSMGLLLGNNNFELLRCFRHFKKLRLEYVLKMFRTFGTNLLPIIKFIEFILPACILKKFFYFYGGEKIIFSRKIITK
jgi:SAM-dependent methyltransferase